MNAAPLLVSLDADAIAAYELFIRFYVECLRRAKSPYAFHSLGSAFAVRATDYVRAGGMRKRSGGEDFYFLQALRKVGPIGGVTTTCVHPSPRPSDRVPFGTGPRVAELVRGDTPIMQLYNPLIFKLLSDTINSVSRGGLDKVNDLGATRRWMATLPPTMSEWLVLQEFPQRWETIVENTPRTPSKRRWAFHTWFDAFRTLKFVHHCEASFPEAFHKVDGAKGATMLSELFASHGLPPACYDVRGILEWLRASEYDERR